MKLINKFFNFLASWGEAIYNARKSNGFNKMY